MTPRGSPGPDQSIYLTFCTSEALRPEAVDRIEGVHRARCCRVGHYARGMTTPRKLVMAAILVGLLRHMDLRKGIFLPRN